MTNRKKIAYFFVVVLNCAYRFIRNLLRYLVTQMCYKGYCRKFTLLLLGDFLFYGLFLNFELFMQKENLIFYLSYSVKTAYLRLLQKDRVKRPEGLMMFAGFFISFSIPCVVEIKGIKLKKKKRF